jgi:hypothetical protein
LQRGISTFKVLFTNIRERVFDGSKLLCVDKIFWEEPFLLNSGLHDCLFYAINNLLRFPLFTTR